MTQVAWLPHGRQVDPAQRTPLRAPTFIRVLARLTQAEPRPSAASLSERLGQWIDWNHAVVLARALDGTPAVQPCPAAPDDDADSTSARARAALAADIADEAAWEAAIGTRGTAPGPQAAPHAAFASFQRRYLALQNAMQATTGRLRGQLRDRLAATSAEMARLADIDAAMERVLSPREHALLGSVPGLLGRHFERMHHEVVAAREADTPPSPEARATADCLAAIRRDMQAVLLAELDVRFQPIEALLAALRTPPQEPHA